jgi:4-cresol dehydrogenase (hydroxylating)
MTQVDTNDGRSSGNPDAVREALGEFACIVGANHVRGSDDALSRSSTPYPKRIGGVVYPGTPEEVAEVVRAAGRRGVSLWPCSRGRNWGYGSATPASDDSIVLHLERLDKILEVNEKLAYAVIEPGVTYRQLSEFLAKHHPNLWMDCTDGTPGGSVVGNALDRGLGTTHYADHFGTLCGLEVVLASGDVVRTGGGPPDCKTWNTHKWGVGPYVEGLFSQSGLGVVVKAGIWLIPKPESFVSFTFDLADEQDLPKLVEIIRELQLRQIVTSAVHLINDVVSLAVVAQYPAELVGRTSRLSESVLDGMRARYGVARWSFGGGLMGSSSSVRFAKSELRRTLRGLGRLTFLDEFMVRGVQLLLKWRRRPWLASLIDGGVKAVFGKSPEMLHAAPEVHGVLRGIPSDYFVRHAYFKARIPKPESAHPDRDNIGLTWFAPIAPMTAEHVMEVLEICRPRFERFGFDFYIALLVQNPRSMIVLTCILFDKEDAEETSRAQALYDELGSATTAAGYQQYRTATPGMHKLANSAPQFVSLVRSIRESLDPGHVIAPGKYGA